LVNVSVGQAGAASTVAVVIIVPMTLGHDATKGLSAKSLSVVLGRSIRGCKEDRDGSKEVHDGCG
jgi:hypothetical protein